jgi:hypothetical protein
MSNPFSIYKKPGVYITHTDETYIKIPKNNLRKIKIRRILGLPPKEYPIFISPGVSIYETF